MGGHKALVTRESRSKRLRNFDVVPDPIIVPHGGDSLEGSNRHSVGERALCAIVAVIAMAGGMLAGAGVGRAHSGDEIDSLWAPTPPTVDGTMAAGEWAGATSVDLGAIPGNRLSALLLVTNDDTYLWIAYDAVGDTTASSDDSASFAFDTGHDGVSTDGGEDQFYLGSTTVHLVWAGGTYTYEDMPFDPSLPDHAGLAGVRGFGSSDASATDHRIYEFQVPLVLIGASPGDTAGFFGGSMPSPGVMDYQSSTYDTWPDYVTAPIPIDAYGNLNLAILPGPIGVLLRSSATGANGRPGETVWYNLTARNIGTAVSDTFDITASGVWTVTLWDATGTTPLADTDGDGVPDTGNLTSGSSAAFVVKIGIPPSATGCDVATVTARSSWDLSILDTSTLRTCIGPALFSPPHSDHGVDTNGNLLFDYLEIDVSIAVTTASSYFLGAELYDQAGSILIDTESTTFFGFSGPNIVTLYFLGRTIYDSGIDGPYLVELVLYDTMGTLIDTDTHLTASYLATDFEAPAASFRPPHSDRGVDTDVPPNGLYDELDLDVGLTVNLAGTIYIDSVVYDSGFSYVTSQGDTFTPPTGDQTVTIRYPGDAFYEASWDGPYEIQLQLYDGFMNWLDSDTYTTGTYLQSDFDPPPIAFAPPHSDHGEDTDVPPDGLFDWLVVSASLDVAEAGDFTLGGTLYSPSGWFIADAYAEATLGLGPATMDLRFPGWAIRESMESGNFDVSMFVARKGDNTTSDYDSYTTGYYDWMEFPPPPARFAPPHADHGVDSSDPPDGLYDWLEVDASVNVTKAGRFTVYGYLWGYLDPLATATTTTDVPTAAVVDIPLYFDGHAIGVDSVGGPYEVDLVLYDADRVELDFGIYYTNAYSPTDFQSLDGSPPTSAASVGGGYWKNGPFAVSYTATDFFPSDGLQSVRLAYRHSLDNATWSAWKLYDADNFEVKGDAQVAGSFLFDLPDGDGYYEFRTGATDHAGNSEAVPASADASAGAFVPARLDLTPATGAMAAGSTRAFQVSVQTAAGYPAPLESPLVISLLKDSAGGEFRATGTSTVITTITIPAGESQAAFDYTDTLAGTSTVTVASAAAAPDSAALTVSPGIAASIEITPAIGGIAVGFSVTLTATVRDSYGNAIPAPTVTWSVEGPGSLSGTSGVSVSMAASGNGTIRVTATSGSASASLAVAAYGAGGDGGVSNSLVLGLGGGLVIGIVVGVAVGWLVGRRRKVQEPASPLPPTPPPAAPPPPAQPPGGPG